MFVRESWRAAGVVHGFLDAAESPSDRDWTRALGALDIAAAVVTPKQVHGNRAVVTTGNESPGEADAIVTDRRGLAVGVATADCVPVLLRAPGTAVVAAVHAGWRGAASGILDAGVRTLCAVSGVRPSMLEATIGPAIGPCCYQVGTEVYEAFQRTSGDTTARAWAGDGDRFRLDLREAARLLLGALGVDDVSVSGPCTRCTPTLNSYRRDAEAAGRQLSFIVAR